jgi:hypothetical protein
MCTATAGAAGVRAVAIQAVVTGIGVVGVCALPAYADIIRTSIGVVAIRVGCTGRYVLAQP